MYLLIGEEQGVFELVKYFYEIMESEKPASKALLTHDLVDGKIPDEIKKRLFMFLCGWFGGPNLFIEAYGPPKMMARHAHVKIGSQETDAWLYCIKKALKKHSSSLSKKERFLIENSFKALAQRIQNA